MQKISTLTGIIIIVVVAVILFGGVVAWQYHQQNSMFFGWAGPVSQTQINPNVQSQQQNQQQQTINQQTKNIQQSITVISPNGGENWQIGSENEKYTIKWTYKGVPDNAQVYLYIMNYGVTPIKACGVPSMGIQIMPISQKQITVDANVFGCTRTGNKFKVNISLLDNTNKNPLFAISDNYFSITNFTK